MESNKSIREIVLDSGAIVNNEPPIDTLLACSKNLYTVPSVLSEIRDANTRARLDNLLKPFLKVQGPSDHCLQAVIDFAKKSGDFSVLSRTDLEILALTYELEIRLSGGKDHLRQLPGQKLPINKVKPQGRGSETSYPSNYAAQSSGVVNAEAAGSASTAPQAPEPPVLDCQTDEEAPNQEVSGQSIHQDDMSSRPAKDKEDAEPPDEEVKVLAKELDNSHIGSPSDRPLVEREISAEHVQPSNIQSPIDSLQSDDEKSEKEDEEGWITPSNLHKHQMKDTNGSTAPETEPSQIGVACITTDFAMQNVLLQIGLNLLSPNLQRIRTIRTYILRCHACFRQVKDTSKQFCPRCGGATLTRVSCSTDAKGVFRIHLKKNMQWNHRGDRYSIPKPISGSANGKVKQGKGGGKGGWGQGLILAEDQKEYQRAVNGSGSRMKAKDLMDEDYLPSILTGDRSRPGGRPKVGAGRNVNSKKRI